MEINKKELNMLKRVEKVLDKYVPGRKTRILSGEFQVEFKLDRQELVVNNSWEKGKDIVVFIGDIGFDMSIKDFDKFLNSNAFLSDGYLTNILREF